MSYCIVSWWCSNSYTMLWQVSQTPYRLALLHGTSLLYPIVILIRNGSWTAEQSLLPFLLVPHRRFSRGENAVKYKKTYLVGRWSLIGTCHQHQVRKNSRRIYRNCSNKRRVLATVTPLPSDSLPLSLWTISSSRHMKTPKSMLLAHLFIIRECTHRESRLCVWRRRWDARKADCSSG